MDILINFPLDADGFIRRECPACEREFKWFDGATEDRPNDWNDPPVYWCPLCGRSSNHDQFYTTEQVKYIEQSMAGPAADLVNDELDNIFRGMKGFTVKKSGGAERPEPPTPLTEPNDMNQLQSPCHPWEPVKIPENSASPYYCLVCGAAYGV